MNNWHHKVIKLHLLSNDDKKGSKNVYVSVTEGYPEYIPKTVNSDLEYRFTSSQYQISHPRLHEEKIFFSRQPSDNFDNDDKSYVDDNWYTQDLKLNYFNEKGHPNNYFSAHANTVSSIIVANINNDNLICGISPNSNIITCNDFEDIPMATLTAKYIKSNIDSEFYNNKIAERYLVYKDAKKNKKYRILGELPENSGDGHNDKFAYIINFSASWSIKDTDPNKILSSKSVGFILNDLFAYGRNGKGCLVICASGNGHSNDGTEPVGFNLSDPNPIEVSPFLMSKKSFLVGATDTQLSFPPNYDATSQLPTFIESKAGYSNYGPRLDICAPSSPSGSEKSGDLSIYGATNLKCGNVGNNDDYISCQVKEVKEGTENTTIILKGNQKFIFPGQAIELGDYHTFLHETRFIIDVAQNEKDNTTMLTLDLPLKYTKKDIIPSFSLVDKEVKILVWKKEIIQKIDSFQISIDDTRGMQANQDVFIFTKNDFKNGIVNRIDTINYAEKKITLKGKLPNDLSSDLFLIPGQIELTVNYSISDLEDDKGKFYFTINNLEKSRGFFPGQMIMIDVNGKYEITHITSIHHSHPKYMANKPDSKYGPNEKYGYTVKFKSDSSLTFKSLTYGDYTSRFGGTSAATPIVSGVAALVLSANKNLNASEIKHILKTTADQIGGPYKINTTINSNYNFNYNVNDFFGTGRVNAYKAVNLAKIWHNPNNTSFKKPKLRLASSAFQPFIYIDGAVDGNFNTNTDQKIKVRLENYGNLHSFQETDLRILVAFTNEDNPKFKFPDYWYENKINSVDENGKKLETKVCLLDVQEIIPIAPGTETNHPISIDWKDVRGFLSKNGYDPKIHKIFILAHIAPFDGTNSDLAGYTSQDAQYNDKEIIFDTTNNKNLASVQIIPADAVPSNKLSDGTKVPLNGENYRLITNSTEKKHEKFCVDISNILATELDTKQFKFSLLDKPNGAVESEVIIKKNNGNWDLSNLPDWLTADIVETDSALYAATHKNAEINYALSYDLTKAGKQIQFAVI